MASAWHRRVEAANWDAVAANMNDDGGALLPEVMTPAECAAVLDLNPDDGLFRSTVDMSPYRFGQSEGVATVRSGERYTLGLVFHEAA